MAEIKWVEVSLTVSAEQAEAVAEVLNRTIPNGVVVEQKALQNNPDEDYRVESNARVFGYLLADGSLEEKKKQLEVALWHLGQIQPLPATIAAGSAVYPRMAAGGEVGFGGYRKNI